MNCFIKNPFSESLISGNIYKKTARKNQSPLRMTDDSVTQENNKRRQILKFAATISSISLFGNKSALAEKPAAWTRISLPVDTVLFDLDFVKDASEHGWLVGSKGTFLETLDGGETWVPRTFANLDPDEELTYRFENVSFSGNDGWVIGKPAIMLHTKDGGKSWLRVPVSPKLPGEPVLITALGPDRAEMTTSSGAVYETTNGGRNWKAQVKETIDSTLNRTISSGISGASYFTGSVIGVIRDADGKYLAISSRGNFFLTWEPGQDFWIPRARETSRRIQAMGFIENNADKGTWSRFLDSTSKRNFKTYPGYGLYRKQCRQRNLVKISGFHEQEKLQDVSRLWALSKTMQTKESGCRQEKLQDVSRLWALSKTMQ